MFATTLSPWMEFPSYPIFPRETISSPTNRAKLPPPPPLGITFLFSISPTRRHTLVVFRSADWWEVGGSSPGGGGHFYPTTFHNFFLFSPMSHLRIRPRAIFFSPTMSENFFILKFRLFSTDFLGFQLHFSIFGFSKPSPLDPKPTPSTSSTPPTPSIPSRNRWSPWPSSDHEDAPCCPQEAFFPTPTRAENSHPPPRKRPPPPDQPSETATPPFGDYTSVFQYLQQDATP